MDGASVPRLVEEFFRPVSGLLDYAFVAGVGYGVFRLAEFCRRCWSGFRVYCLPLGRCASSDMKKLFGEWAVIVGATSGIGQAYAEELARRNMNVVLISKSYDDLVLLVAKIQSEYCVQAYGIHADFSLGRHVYQEIYDALQELEVGILVNDAAIQYDHPQYLVLVPPMRLLQILDENISAATVMTYLLLPQMLERERGAVINVCSQISCFPPTPLLSAYTASMVYLRSLSECLQLETSRRGVLVQTLLPGFVAGSTSCPTFFTPSPATYVRHAVATLGVTSTTCGYWPHSIQGWLTCCLPRWLWVWVVSLLFRRHRLQSITEAKEQGVEQFTRRRKTSVAAGPQAPPTNHHHRPTTATAQPVPLRRLSDGLGLRRSPSPQRKTSAGSAGGTPVNYQGGTPLRPLDQLFPPILHRSSSGANVPSPIPESPRSPHFFFPQNLPPSTSTPLPPHPGGPNIGPPGITQSLPVATRPKKPRPSIVYSKVTVMPSLVRFSQQAEQPPPLPPASTSSGGEPLVAGTNKTSDSQRQEDREEKGEEREETRDTATTDDII